MQHTSSKADLTSCYSEAKTVNALTVVRNSHDEPVPTWAFFSVFVVQACTDHWAHMCLRLNLPRWMHGTSRWWHWLSTLAMLEDEYCMSITCLPRWSWMMRRLHRLCNEWFAPSMNENSFTILTLISCLRHLCITQLSTVVERRMCDSLVTMAVYYLKHTKRNVQIRNTPQLQNLHCVTHVLLKIQTINVMIMIIIIIISAVLR